MRLHHVGVVVPDIESSIEYYETSFGMKVLVPKTLDPLQQVNVAFLGDGQSSVMLELIEPASEQSPVSRTLKNGGGLNHLCYAVESLDTTLDTLRRERALVVLLPTPAVAFGGRNIAFVYTKEKELVELLEEGS